MSRKETRAYMSEFDDIIAGLKNIFDEGTNVFDVQSQVGSFPTDKYVEIEEGVNCRRLKSKDDIRYHREGLARGILSKLPDVGPNVIMMFCEFMAEGEMRSHAHPQKERTYILSGELKEATTGRLYKEGAVVSYSRMVSHRPISPKGCFLLVTWYGV